MTAMIIKRMGHEVESFDGIDTLKKAINSGNIPCLFFIDYRLSPTVNGIDVLNWLREDAKLKDVRYVALTADVSESDKLKKSGFEEVVLKPITDKMLKQLVMKFDR